MEQVTAETTEDVVIQKGPLRAPPICPNELAKAKESFAVNTTILLSPGRQRGSNKMFYAHFIMNMNIQWTNRIPTAGVSITNSLNLFINPEFYNSLSPIQQRQLMEHEIEHIVFMHPLRIKEHVGESNREEFKRFNIAADSTINENKKELTKDLGVTFDRLNKELESMGSKDRVGPHMSSEQIYDVLKDNNMGGDGGCGEGEIDDHSTWGESNANAEIAKNLVKGAANKAQAATGIGNMPEHIVREIMNMNKPSVNWKRELMQFFVNSLRFDFERTRNRRNRRYGIYQPGRRKKPQLHVAICVDSSGSVYDEAFAQFFAEIDVISDMGVEITIIDADTDVAAVYKYEKKKPIQRHGNGGTAYSPAIQRAKELGVDGILYFGDMDAADTPTDPKIPFLWCIVGNSNPPADFGHSVRVTVEGGR